MKVHMFVKRAKPQHEIDFYFCKVNGFYFSRACTSCKFVLHAKLLTEYSPLILQKQRIHFYYQVGRSNPLVTSNSALPRKKIRKQQTKNLHEDLQSSNMLHS